MRYPPAGGALRSAPSSTWTFAHTAFMVLLMLTGLAFGYGVLATIGYGTSLANVAIFILFMAFSVSATVGGYHGLEDYYYDGCSNHPRAYHRRKWSNWLSFAFGFAVCLWLLPLG